MVSMQKPLTKNEATTLNARILILFVISHLKNAHWTYCALFYIDLTANCWEQKGAGSKNMSFVLKSHRVPPNTELEFNSAFTTKICQTTCIIARKMHHHQLQDYLESMRKVRQRGPTQHTKEIKKIMHKTHQNGNAEARVGLEAVLRSWGSQKRLRT